MFDSATEVVARPTVKTQPEAVAVLTELRDLAIASGLDVRFDAAGVLVVACPSEIAPGEDEVTAAAAEAAPS